MKKYFAFILALTVVAVIGLFGCEKKQAPKAEAQPTVTPAAPAPAPVAAPTPAKPVEAPAKPFKK